MKFPNLEDGDLVVLEQTDCRRTFFDMGPHPIAVVTASDVRDKSFMAKGMRFSRNTGVAIGPPGIRNLSVRPYSEGIEEKIAEHKKSKHAVNKENAQ